MRERNFNNNRGGDNRGNNYRRGGGGNYRGGNNNRRGSGGGRPFKRNNNRHFDIPAFIQKTPIKIEKSLFTLPEHELTLAFQRAIGMAEGTLVEFDDFKSKGMVQIGDVFYKLEDCRPDPLKKRFPLKYFVEKDIKFNFWPTYSQKAAQYRSIEDSPTIKLSNLRKELPEPNAIEIIGQVLMVDTKFFVMKIISVTQKKFYLATVMGLYRGEAGEFIQMHGELKEGAIHYKSSEIIVDSEKLAS